MYDGIDSFFDDTKYKCDNNDLETLLQDINYHWGLDHSMSQTVIVKTTTKIPELKTQKQSEKLPDESDKRGVL